MDHDQRFKSLIREFFADFLQLFFANWAARFDLNAVQWLDKELLSDPPEGARHQLDLVARLLTRERITDSQGTDPETWLALIHIEIESPERTTALKPRLPRYYIHLRQQYELPVLPIVLYLKVGLEGIGIDAYEERFGELCPLRFEYLYVGLPGLDAVQYVEGENWLGVALSALMRIPRDRAAWLGAEALRRLAEAPLQDQQKFLLADCVEAYLSLDEQQQQEYQRMLQSMKHEGRKAMNKTTYDRGLEQGLQGLRRSILIMGRKKFGNPTAEIELQIHRIEDVERLVTLADRMSDVSSWDELLGNES